MNAFCGEDMHGDAHFIAKSVVDSDLRDGARYVRRTCIAPVALSQPRLPVRPSSHEVRAMLPNTSPIRSCAELHKPIQNKCTLRSPKSTTFPLPELILPSDALLRTLLHPSSKLVPLRPNIQESRSLFQRLIRISPRTKPISTKRRILGRFFTLHLAGPHAPLDWFEFGAAEDYADAEEQG